MDNKEILTALRVFRDRLGIAGRADQKVHQLFVEFWRIYQRVETSLNKEADHGATTVLSSTQP